ncbi:MAG: RidA family protein [Alphaproteobacteria bacterium]|nr:RidA family protein [Alphaproteobacteria bacterium]
MIKRSGSYEGILHEVVEHDGVLNFCGIVAEDTKLDMAGQMASVLDQLDALLKEHGSSREKVLTALLFITDMSMKPAMNKVWSAWFPKAHLPTRATIGVKDLGPGVLIEVVFTAAK